ncbi:hypothetical protein [Celerinatantimonas diazotrophica]|uniref:Uncharacterized protein n=1 Tax=Celerinatantimonas diazotrophica TaxID=412034 RepID=A0A4R1K3A4_9GAMM|nr:hypothetical protein [Celerinatantimonas diazotrophica]TCK58576.1 hypothetical protein EV690_0706 [Celerinatantimonas diazotrophica]CAG9297205.1 hypothetical protein CEDIAZO_02375 [Celerinatantimonas diazotrophica]
MNLHQLKILALMTLLSWTTQVNAAPMTTQQAVTSLHLEELANTLSHAQVVNSTHKQSRSKADALMIDLGVIDIEDLNHPHRLSQKLTQFVHDQLDTAENYLGTVDLW